MSSALIIISCAVGLLMIWMHLQHRARVKTRRASMFETCEHLFSATEVVQDDVNFPVLTGQYRGFPVKLEPIADHVGFRKLPSLWLLITVKGAIPYQGVLDYLIRPQNIEFFSPNEQLEYQLEPPAHWPQHAALKTNNIEQMPPVQRLDKHIGLFDDNKVKELLISPRGIRIVYQANQAEQSSYRTLRSLAFNDLSISPELISHLLDKAISIHQDLAENPDHEITPSQPATEYFKQAS